MMRRQSAVSSMRHPLLVGAAVLLAGLASVGVAPERARAGVESPPPGEMPAPRPPEDDPKAPVSEEELLRRACRYLLLSRGQLRQLIPVARQTDQALTLLEREEAPRLRELEKLGDTPEAEALKKAIDARRAEAETRVVKFAAEQLARLWTREQIALAYRLSQASPPLYAHADAAILRGDAGFINPNAAVRLGAMQSGIAFRRDDVGGTEAPEYRLRVESALQLYERALLDLREAGVARQIERNGEKRSVPFAQMVVETNQLSDLIPPVEPIARRLFLSERWLPFLLNAAVRGLGEGSGVSYRMATMGTLRLLREYRMERGYRDLTGKGPELEPMGGELDHGAYLFNAGQGLVLPNAGVTDHYDLEFSFRSFAENGNYQKLLDFKNGTKDGGLYLYQGHVTFYTLADGGVPTAGQEHRLRLERNRYTHIVRGYLDLRPIFAFMDLDGDAVFEKSTGLLFKDDKTTGGEEGPGALRWVSVRGPSRG